MPIIISCPSCSGQLRVADELIGRKVRCPACSNTFEARASSPPAPKEPAAPAEKIDAWKFLDLELKEDPPPRPSPPPLRPTLELDEEIPTAPRDPSPPRREESRPRPRLNDDHDDMFACKVCGRMCHNDARRCSHCGERFAGEDDAPRRRRPRREERRDTEPHRAGFVLAMGIVSLSLLLLCWPLSPVFGLIAWICGRADLRKMRGGSMDPEGEDSTQAGWICGIIGTCLGVVIYLGCGSVIGVTWYQEIENSRRMNQPRVIPPPQVPGQKF